MFDCIKTKKESLTKLNTPIISLNIQLFSFTEEDLKSKLGKFEISTAVLDSGATRPVMNPNTGASYGIIPSSANCTECEIASGDMQEGLGEKLSSNGSTGATKAVAGAWGLTTGCAL